MEENLKLNRLFLSGLSLQISLANPTRKLGLLTRENKP